MVTNENKTSPILILAAWFVVSIPAAWGVLLHPAERTQALPVGPIHQCRVPSPPSPGLALRDDHARSDW